VVTREQVLTTALAILFLAGSVLVGGQTPVALPMFVELIACGLMALAIGGIVDGQFPPEARVALVLLALVCLLPLLQLIPMPASIWDRLPGREAPTDISRYAGLGNFARPITLTPERTQLALLSLIVPVATFLATLQLSVQSRDKIITVIVAFAFLSAVLGVFQVAAGGGVDLGIYAQLHDGYAIGFFANRNHEADLLLLAIPLSTHLIRLRRMKDQTRLFALFALIGFFALSVIGTISRTGIALLPVALIAAAFVWTGNSHSRSVWTLIGLIFAVTIVGFLFVNVTPVGHQAFQRFGDIGGDLRLHIWRGTIAAIDSFWPFGSGVGSFVPTYQMFEDLNSVTHEWVNHAHNEYLEILLEAGLPGAILIGGYFAILVRETLRRQSFPMVSQKYIAVGGIILLLAHSTTDYPLRTFGLITVFAFLNALLYSPRPAVRTRQSDRYSNRSNAELLRVPNG
jgi:O-antigen ligase